MQVELSPAFPEFEKRHKDGLAQIIVARIVSDLETPVTAFLKLARNKQNSFLLESVEGGETLGRYSIIGMRPDLIWRANGAHAEICNPVEGEEHRFQPAGQPPLESLKSLIDASRLSLPDDAPPMAAGVFGFFGYDTVRQMERLGPRPTDAIGAPDAVFIRPTLVAVFDGLKQEIVLAVSVRKVVETSAREAFDAAAALIAGAIADLAVPLSSHPTTAVTVARDLEPELALASNTSKADYLDMVARAREYIAAGDVFQVVLSQRFSARLEPPPFELYRALRRTNPSPFLFFLQFDGLALVGSSPEILVRVRDGEITIRPIAGTRPRGKSPEEDQRLENDLLRDPKERAEHLMLLDLGRNDVGRSAAIGTVRVTEAFTVERYSHVMHIVSNVVGDLAPGVHPVDAVVSGFPAGTVTGAPKIRAMEIIDELEREARGPYGGAIGYFSADGNVDTCIALRTAVVRNGMMHVQAGAGIVADSDAEAEYAECVNKAKALFAAAAAAGQSWSTG